MKKTIQFIAAVIFTIALVYSLPQILLEMWLQTPGVMFMFIIFIVGGIISVINGNNYGKDKI